MFKKVVIVYGCQVYKAVLPLIFIPLLISLLGVDKYGMIAFFYTLVGLLGLLDAGIGGTFLKLIATYKSNARDYNSVAKIFLKVLLLFVVISLCLWLFFNLKENFIITRWLNISINKHEAEYSIKSMGLVLAALYLKSYLSSFINGMEKQEFITIWGGVYNTIFYFGSYYALKNIEQSLFVFFSLMKWLALVDLLMTSLVVVYVYIKHHKILSAADSQSILEFKEYKGSLSLKSVFMFSMQLSGLSLIWVIATQIDKVVLSAYIPLVEYAKYQVAVQVSTSIAIFSAPLSQLLLPRLSFYYSNLRLYEYTQLYCRSLLWFVLILVPIVPYFFIFGSDLISLWMRDNALGGQVNNYARWLVASAFMAAIMNFVFIFLYSVGKLKKHFIAYAIYSSLTIPLSIFFAKNYGASGSAIFVFSHTLCFMLIWGGLQLKLRFPSFAFTFFIFSFIILIISTLNFILLSVIFSGDSSVLLRTFLPPVSNCIVLFILYCALKSKINHFVSSIDMVVK